MKKLLLLSALLLIVIISACASEAEKQIAAENIRKDQQSIDACIKAGGIPIYSSWDGRLKECQFPPNKGGNK